MVIFLTLPPWRIQYPYILMNLRHPEEGIKYIDMNRKSVKMIIIDSGIEIFRNPRVKEYPSGNKGWIARAVNIYRSVKSFAPNADVYVTCGDYCDDYCPRNLWISDTVTNIERTVENVKICVNEYRDVNWLIPIQGWNRRPDSLEKSIKYYYEMGLFDRYKYFAVANLCVEIDDDIIFKSVMVVRRALKEYGVLDGIKLHIFGLKIVALKRVKDMIYSFDSLAWTKPVNSRAMKIRRASAKNESERNLFFCEYIIHLRNRYGVEIPDETVDICRKVIERGGVY